MIASMQPYHVIDDGRWAEGRIGAKRCAVRRTPIARCSTPGASSRSAPTGRSRRSTCWPGIDAAVNRRTLDGKHPDGWFPEQRITVAEAIEAYTLGSAYAALPGEGPRLDPGRQARRLRGAVARHPRPEGEGKIAETKVELTVVGGKVVFERK